MVKFEFGAEAFSDFQQATRREWLETNGRGGFASSTLCLANTRRYHGLLIVAEPVSGERRLLLGKLDATVVAGDRPLELSSNGYAGAIHPCGFQTIQRFASDPWPTWRFADQGVLIEQTLFMPHGQDAVIVCLQLLEAPSAVRLEVRPKVTSRGFHHLCLVHQLPEPHIVEGEQSVSVGWGLGLTGVTVSHDGRFVRQPCWYYQLVYDMEWKRGYESREDLFCPGAITWELEPGQTARLIGAPQPFPIEWADRWIESEGKRRKKLTAKLPTRDALYKPLARAADCFVVRSSGDRPAVLAGYHWFAERSRDSFISMPGLLLVTGRFPQARALLVSYGGMVSQGMVPQSLNGPDGRPDYRAIDTTFWFVHALRRYVDYTDDWSAAEELYDALRDIMRFHESGTRFGIRVDEDGLLGGGPDADRLTWMDARVGDWVVTPRTGKPVEVQALWYGALQFMKELAERAGQAERCRHYDDLAARTADSFQRTFWCEETRCCCDAVSPDGRRDAAVRPNQIVVLALQPGLLSESCRRCALEVVQQELLTPVGLRTLSPRDPAYRGHYMGDALTRDGAYHQGTVWTWLLGPFITAFVNLNGRTPQVRRKARRLLDPLLERLTAFGVGQLPEIADGDEPHHPRGCIAQACALAEPLRALAEDILELGPRRNIPGESADLRAGSRQTVGP